MICNVCKNDFPQTHFNQKLCSNECKAGARRIVLKKHKETDLWKISNKRWQMSEKFKINEKKYRENPVYKKKAVIRSTKSLKNSPSLQAKKRIRDIEFSKSEKGREINKISRKKYGLTDKCKIVMKNSKAKRRSFEKNGKISLAEWNEVLVKNDGKCAKCKTDKRIEMDHIIPLSKGGKHSILNIQPLCRSCNASKGNRIWQN